MISYFVFFSEILSYFVPTAPVVLFHAQCLVSFSTGITRVPAPEIQPHPHPLVKAFLIASPAFYMDPLQAHSIKEHGVEISWSLLLLTVFGKYMYFLETVFQMK